MEILYEKYLNIQKFIVQYRKYTLIDKFYSFADFKKNIQIDEYILHKCIDVKNGRSVFIYLFKDQSKYIKTTIQFKRLMDKLPTDIIDVIIISKDELSIYINKALLKYNNIRIYNYKHQYFSIELSKGPLCSKHTILSNSDVRILCSQDLIIHPLSLPSISINDPQNIWIGGELGQIIKIESVSEITGKTIRYRIVSPDSGKMINIQNLKQKLQANDIDDEVKENTSDLNSSKPAVDTYDDDDDDDDDDIDDDE